MEGLRAECRAAAMLASYFSTDFVLVDIGCSGGIAPGWRALGERLAAAGFDAGLDEIFRLREAETNPKIQYFSGFIGIPADHPLAVLRQRYGYWRRNPWPHLSVSAAMEQCINAAEIPLTAMTDCRNAELQEATRIDTSEKPIADQFPLKAAIGVGRPGQADHAGKMYRNEWHDTPLADTHNPVLLGRALDMVGVGDLDMLKIDVDGPDYEILASAADLINDRQALGVVTEVNFFGSEGPDHNTFHNTDRLMRSLGFSLFGLTTRSYSNRALPSPFLVGYPAQSLRGRPLQGDALYLRDVAIKTIGPNADTLDPDKLLKLAAIFALADLPDEAASVLVRFRKKFEKLSIDVDALLDALAAQAQPDRPNPWTYQEYIEAFARRDPWFDMTSKARLGIIAADEPEGEEAEPTSEALLRHEIGELRRALDATRASTSWKISEPVRWLAKRLRASSVA